MKQGNGLWGEKYRGGAYQSCLCLHPSPTSATIIQGTRPGCHAIREPFHRAQPRPGSSLLSAIVQAPSHRGAIPSKHRPVWRTHRHASPLLLLALALILGKEPAHTQLAPPLSPSLKRLRKGKLTKQTPPPQLQQRPKPPAHRPPPSTPTYPDHTSPTP